MKGQSGQRGMVLIVVLVILTVVTLIGVAAMRASNLNLIMATNSQANMLLFQASDAGINAVMDNVSSDVNAALLSTGTVGAALLRPGAEDARCFTVASKLASGTCDPSTANKTFSGRGASYVQVSTVMPLNAAGEGRSAKITGTDDDAVPVLGGYELRVLSTAAMPDFSGVSASVTKACFEKPADDSETPSTESVTDCMKTNSIASVTTVQEFCLGYTCQQQ